MNCGKKMMKIGLEMGNLAATTTITTTQNFVPLDWTFLKPQSSTLHRKKAQTIGYQLRGFMRPYTTSKGPKMAAEF